MSNTSRRGKEGLIVSGRRGWQTLKVGETPVIDVVAGKLAEAWKEKVAFEEAQAAWEARRSALVLGRKRPGEFVASELEGRNSSSSAGG